MKEDIAKKGFDALTDIDRNGKVDIKDYAVLFDYLNLNGPPPPGNHLDAKKRVKLEFIPSEKEQDYFELVLSSNDEIFAFDLSFYGLAEIVSVDNSTLDDIEFTKDRVLWLGNGEKGQKEIRLKVACGELSKSKKICMRAPVFLDQNHQYFGVKLGKCYDVFVEKIVPPLVIKEKKEKIPKPEKVKKEKTPKKEKEPKKIKEPKEKRETLGEKKEKGNDRESNSSEESITENLDNTNQINEKEETKTSTENKLAALKKVNEISNKEKKKNSEANDPVKISTVKILSLNKLQIKTTIATKGQMIFNNEDNIFMVFNGVEWGRLNAVPGVSIEE